jgi:hypothetical protein
MLEGEGMKMPFADRYQEVIAVALIVIAWSLVILFVASLVFG